MAHDPRKPRKSHIGPPGGFIRAITRIGTVHRRQEGFVTLADWHFDDTPICCRIPADQAGDVLICGYSIWFLESLAHLESQWSAPPRDDLYPVGHPHHKEPNP